MTLGSVCTGIAGLDIAVEMVFRARTIWHAEPDPYAAAVLRRHWPHVPNYGRMEMIGESSPRPSIICGGPPCQDISLAGKGEGLDGFKSKAWWEYARVLELLRPSIAIVEQVRALVGRGLDLVLGTLATLGYDAEWGCFKASDVGAPHQRSRIFIVAAQSSGIACAEVRIDESGNLHMGIVSRAMPAGDGSGDARRSVCGLCVGCFGVRAMGRGHPTASTRIGVCARSGVLAT